MTPPIPCWVKDAQPRGYVNVFALCPNETRLYGTESMFGDWNGRVLLLAKDFACSKLVHDRMAQGDKRPYRHKRKLRTNIRLMRFVEPIASCGLLYGSALACLLRDDGNMSGPLPNRTEALRFGAHVLKDFVIPSMSHLEMIVCMGEEAWECATAAVETRVHLTRVPHPAARISNEKMQQAWDQVYELLV